MPGEDPPTEEETSSLRDTVQLIRHNEKDPDPSSNLKQLKKSEGEEKRKEGVKGEEIIRGRAKKEEARVKGSGPAPGGGRGEKKEIRRGGREGNLGGLW